MPEKELTREELLGGISFVQKTTESVVSALWDDLLRRSSQDRPHEDAFVYEHLMRAFSALTEETLRHQPADETWASARAREVVLGPWRVRVEVNHRGSGEAVYGVDLLYTIVDIKSLAFQHKKRDQQGRIVIDKRQLRKIRRLCFGCPHARTPYEQVPSVTRVAKQRKTRSTVLPGCSVLYAVDDPGVRELEAVSACQIRRVENRAAPPTSENSGVYDGGYSLPAVDEMFLRCLIGHPAPPDEGRGEIDILKDILVSSGHLVFDVEQSLSAEPR